MVLLSAMLLFAQPAQTYSNIYIHEIHNTNYQYKFKISGVLTHGDTKPVMDVVAGILGKRPVFNEETQYFEIISDIEISEDAFSVRMEKSGYSITNFSRILDNSQPK